MWNIQIWYPAVVKKYSPVFPLKAVWAAVVRPKVRRDGWIKTSSNKWKRSTPVYRCVSQRSTQRCTPFITTGCRARTPHRPRGFCTPNTKARFRAKHSPHTCSGEMMGILKWTLKGWFCWEPVVKDKKQLQVDRVTTRGRRLNSWVSYTKTKTEDQGIQKKTC